MLDILVCFIGWLLIASQTWSVKYHFNVQKLPNGAKLISVMVIAGAILLSYLTFRHAQPKAAQSIGALLLVASFILFWRTIRESKQANLLAAFDEHLPHGLLTTGPYKYVRHPFYSSYILHWVGWAIAAWNVWAIVPVAAMVTTYWIAARDEEAKFAQTELFDSYNEYRGKTGRFIPRL